MSLAKRHSEFEDAFKPLRPALLTLDMAAGFAPPIDSPLSSVDWTATDTRLTPTIREFHANESSDIAISGVQIQLAKRIVAKVSLVVNIANTGASTAMRFAITNATGSSVFFESDNVVVPAGGGSYAFTYIHKTTPTTAVLVLRAAVVSGTNLTIQPMHVATVERIGRTDRL